MGVARLYEMLATRAAAEFQLSPGLFVENLEPYLKEPPGRGIETFAYVPDRDRLERVRAITRAAGVPMRTGVGLCDRLMMSEYEWHEDDTLQKAGG